jgi:two-component system, NarL family, sensor histidine kinase LiaS
MTILKKIFRFFRSLRGKLILTYTLVTVLALLALEASLFLIIMLASGTRNSDREGYLSDVVYVLYPQAQYFLQPGKEDLPGLQAWLDSVNASGRASLPPQDWIDSPAAIITPGSTLYVLSTKATILAQSPRTGNDLTGRLYALPDQVESLHILDNALRRDFNALDLYAVQPDGSYLMAVPVPQASRDTQLVGVIVLSVRPPPSMIQSLWPVLIVIVLATGLLLLVAVAPFGALFGFIMSSGLTRRLQALTLAVDAWSEGNFSIQPQDKSQDEISYLGRRMRHMAERVQALLQTQHELALLEERNRLARELHDTLKQQTFATLMQVRAARNLLESDPPAAGQHLAEAEDLIRTSQQELGLIISELRPAALQGQGLADALRSYLETWSKHACIPADFQAQNERRLPLEVELALYRVAQEALANAAHHSRASAVTLRLVFAGPRVSLSIADNGVGFDLSTGLKQGLGLQTMRERLELLGGQVEIQTTPGEGTRVTASILVTQE